MDHPHCIRSFARRHRVLFIIIALAVMLGIVLGPAAGALVMLRVFRSAPHGEGVAQPTPAPTSSLGPLTITTSLKASVAGERKGVVIILSGLKVEQRHAHSWTNAVVLPLSKDGHASVQVVVCVDRDNRAQQPFLWSAAIEAGATVDVPDRPAIADAYADQFVRLAACYHASRQAANYHQPLYYVRGRPELVWHGRFPPIAVFMNDAVSAKARAFVRVNPAPFELSASSCPDSFAEGDPAHTTCGFSNTAEVQKRREALAAANITTCVLIDDQFAVVPAQLADAYFKLEANFPRQPSLKIEAFVANKLPRKSNIDPDTWVRSCLGNGKGADMNSRPNAEANVTWLSKFDTLWHGQYGRGSHDFKHGCCESRLSWRLAGRQVPLDIRGFLFESKVMKEHSNKTRTAMQVATGVERWATC